MEVFLNIMSFMFVMIIAIISGSDEEFQPEMNDVTKHFKPCGLHVSLKRRLVIFYIFYH